MEFGKLEDIRSVSFQFPGDVPRTLQTLTRYAERAPHQALQVRVGAPVWGAKKWVGSVYPLGTSPADFLKYYSRQFHCIELNTTHYRIPDAETVARWRESVPPDFKFCPKIPQQISHGTNLRGVESATHEFVERVRGLGPTLGVSFLQLPPSFEPRSLISLQRWLDLLPTDFALAVEFRHPHFFDEHQLIPEAVNLLMSREAGTVITDVAGRRDVLHMSLTNGRAFLRFIGNDLHPTDFTRLHDWVIRIAHWRQAGLRELDFIVHEPGDTHAPEMIRVVIEQLNKVCNLNLRNWEPQTQGTQLDFFS